MKTLITVAIFLFSFFLQASQFSWNLQITNPEFEIKNIRLGKKEYKPYLKKTKWHCWAKQTEKKSVGNNFLEVKSLSCNYSVRKAGKVTTFVSCSPRRPYGESLLVLYDEIKRLTFKIMLTCQFNTSLVPTLKKVRVHS